MTQAYPLKWPEGWPRTPNYQRQRAGAKFGHADFTTSVVRLERELHLLKATNRVLSTNLKLRMDGRPYAEESLLQDPGVAIYFQLRGRAMSMARDTYDRVRDNIRSLALAVEYMRGLERHGGSYMLERAFSGFGALPPPAGSGNEPALNWREELGPIPEDMEDWEVLALIEARYRKKAKTVHSDQGGDDAAMIRLNAAVAQARKELNN